MSSVKKLSLRGIKSTFRRKSSRDNVATDSKSQYDSTESTNRYVFDYDGPKSKGLHENVGSVGTTNNLENVQDRHIHDDGNKEDIKNLETKMSRWKFRHKSEAKSKIDKDCGVARLADIAETPPGSTEECDESRKPRPPSSNGHVIMGTGDHGSTSKTGYVGATPPKPSTIGMHSFHTVERPRHQYVNDSADPTSMKLNSTVSKSVEGNFINPENPCKTCTSECVKGEGNEHTNESKVRVPSDRSCSESDTAFAKSDLCLSSTVNVDESQNAVNENGSVPSDVPPAIPPKPASFHKTGKWILSSERGENDVEAVPPRPPARTKTRHHTDIASPFYKQLQYSFKSFQSCPIYEAVEVNSMRNGGLVGDLSKLPRQPWYWGPLSQEEAEEKLEPAADGSFLVRDSSDERYLLTLSFKSNGRTLHTRIEHRNGLFSLHESEGHQSVIDLVHSAVKESQKGVYGYMNDSSGIQNYPARLTQWVSRFSEVKSLQHLCRFVIRETFPRHHIRKLPLPRKINEYILENQY